MNIALEGVVVQRRDDCAWTSMGRRKVEIFGRCLGGSTLGLGE